MTEGNIGNEAGIATLITDDWGSSYETIQGNLGTTSPGSFWSCHMLGFSEHLVHWSLPLIESPQSPSFRLLRGTSPSIPLNPGHSGFSGLCSCNSLHGWVLSHFDHRLQNGTLWIAEGKGVRIETMPTCFPGNDNFFPFFHVPIGAGKKNHKLLISQ